MIFLNIYIGFSILTFILVLMQSHVIMKQLERKYPDHVDEFKKNNKPGVLEGVFSYIKTFIGCFVPIVNICIFYVVLFEAKMVEEQALNNMLKDKERFK